MDYMRLLAALPESEASSPFFANILVTLIPIALIVVAIVFFVIRVIAGRRKHDENMRKIFEAYNKKD